MLAAETEAADPSIFLLLKTKNPPSSERWIRVDALGAIRLIAALTKLSQSAQRTRFITGR
jgi:hypothetical protein